MIPQVGLIVDESIYYMVDDSQNRSQICEAGCTNAEQRGGRAEKDGRGDVKRR